MQLARSDRVARAGENPLRWIMIALAFLATLINYLDRQALSVAAPILRDQFHMSNTAYSGVIFAFMAAYTIMNGVSGPLLDRFGTKVGYAISLAWWSAASMLHALSTGPWSLGFYRFLLGMGEAANWPAAVKVVAEWFPPRERPLASGMFNSGSAVGAIVAPPLFAWIILRYGWQDAFAFVGLIGLIFVAIWGGVYYTPAKSQEEAPPPVPIGYILGNRFVRSFTLAKVFMDPVWYFYIFWFPEYLARARKLDMAHIGRYAWIPFLIAGFGNFLGGWLSTLLMRWGMSLSTARKVAVTFFSTLMVAAVGAVLTPDVRLSFGLVSLAMMGYTGSLANMLAFPSDVFPSSAVGSVYGLASMGSGLGGMIFMLITGWTVDHFSYTPVFFGFGIMPLICVGILWSFMGPLTHESAGKEIQHLYAN